MSIRLLSTILLTTMLGGCASFYNHVHDPGLAVPSASVIKSIRCELVTYFESNFQRSLQHESTAREIGLDFANTNYGYLDLDRWQYAAIEINFSDIISANASLGVDLKYPFGTNNSFSRTYHGLPSIGVNGTYVKNQLFAIPQYASLGPVLAGVKDETEKLYYDESKLGTDKGYFCYKSLGQLKMDRSARLQDLQGLSTGKYPQRELFNRIFVDGGTTLAQWLQNSSQDLSNIQRTAVPTSENVIPAQISYSFALESKAGADAKYTLVASALNPLVPDINGGIDNTNKFTVYLNASKSKAASAAKVGQASIGAKDAKLVPQTVGVISEIK